jgi:hypothetical protein
MTLRYPCVCCGYVTLDEPPGSYQICPVCSWEDDVVQLRWPDSAGGANRSSLLTAQQDYERSGRPAPNDVARDPDWRPIDLRRDRFEPEGVQLLPWPDDRTAFYWWRRPTTSEEPDRTGEPSADLIAEAVRHPGGSVAEIDRALIGDPDGYIPGEAIRGAWKVDAEGHLTGEFVPNPSYGPPRDDFTQLTGSDHWLDWLGDDPAATIRQSVAEIVDEQVPGATVRWMKITDEPRYLTAGRRVEDDPDHLILTRAALAVSFAIGVDSPSGPFEILWGVHSIAIVGLDSGGQARSRAWFDLWTSLDTAEEDLRVRITEVG